MAILPEFKTERLILRELSVADIPAYKRYFNDYNVVQHLSDALTWPLPKNSVEYFIHKKVIPLQGNDKWVWGIFLKQNPQELIGVVDLWRKCSPENRGFWLGHKFWGKGIMTEAVEPITAYAFTGLGFEKLVFAHAVGNKRSRRVKEKCGAVFIRTEPSNFVNPKYTEHEVWELTKKSWAEQQIPLISRKQAKEIITKYKEAWENQDSTAILKIFTKNASYHEKVLAEPMVGHAAIKAYWETKVCKEQANISFNLLSLYTDADTIIAEWEAEFDDIIKGVRKYMKEVAILDIEDGKISALREYWSSKSLGDL